MSLGGPDWWRLAVGTLTALPVAPPRVVDGRVAGRAMLLAPVAYLPVLALLALTAAVLWLCGATPVLVAVLLLAAGLWSCRAMHLDGVADLADGLSASYDATRSLEVMRRGDTGPGGVVAIVLVLLVDAAALASLAAEPRTLCLAALAALASRHALAWACAGTPAARDGGLGAAVARTVSTTAALAASAALCAAGALGCVGLGLPWYSAASTIGAALLATALVLRAATRRLGGLTGDVLGACVEYALAAALVAAALSS